MFFFFHLFHSKVYLIRTCICFEVYINTCTIQVLHFDKLLYRQITVSSMLFVLNVFGFSNNQGSWLGRIFFFQFLHSILSISCIIFAVAMTSCAMMKMTGFLLGASFGLSMAYHISSYTWVQATESEWDLFLISEMFSNMNYK